MTTTHPQPTQQRNEKIDWDEVEKEKKRHSNPYNKNNETDIDDEEDDVDFDEKAAREERGEH